MGTSKYSPRQKHVLRLRQTAQIACYRLAGLVQASPRRENSYSASPQCVLIGSRYLQTHIRSGVRHKGFRHSYFSLSTDRWNTGKGFRFQQSDDNVILA
ncbi:uncharacterized protein YALI1_A20760g [Yarrowia lipolytica]|uniref:Uncharacterized protein n=1 Tax=Yarrowia lipolytica TaxID=4952 RepID=A0A1D8N5J1_YARLL|nr:hypothetical protein YALI1_A20760g [Yarrowia lipolytica]